MRILLLLCLAGGLAACGASNPDRSDPVHPRQGPQVTGTGISISGDARIGVVGVF